MVERARALIGTRFRPQGRGVDGIDCVGLAAAAFGVAAPSGYALRGGDPAAVARVIEGLGLRPVDKGAAGDLVLCSPGAGQLHLVVLSGRGFIHADAGLRRVVEVPGVLPWAVLGVWRSFSAVMPAEAGIASGGAR